ncbi:MAG: hypothetical protein KF900_00005, partial [Bacteroidetes bacterium]|nr:hypothetical protein [Bacteroidota bacterium]
MRKLILFAFILFSFASCESYWTLARSESFVNETKQAEKIICLNPQIQYYAAEKNLNIKKAKKLTTMFYKSLLKFSKKNSVPFEIAVLDENASGDYYNHLTALRENLTEVNLGNYESNISAVKPEEGKFVKGVFVYAPKISHEFNSFSKTFGTKYFSFINIVIYEGGFVLHHIVVDTDLCETVFSER